MVDHYELLYLVGANHSEEELTPIKAKVKALLDKANAEITFDESFGKKKLAYPIKGNHQGYYLVYEFNIEGAEIKELDRNVGLLNEVLRHMVAKRTSKAPNMMRAADDIIDKDSLEAPMTPRPSHSPRPVHATVPTAPAPIVEVTPEEKEKDKAKIEELDSKLDQIIEGNIL